MNEETKVQELEKNVKRLRKHLRIAFVISSIALLMIVGHFILHATGNIPH